MSDVDQIIPDGINYAAQFTTVKNRFGFYKYIYLNIYLIYLYLNILNLYEGLFKYLTSWAIHI